MVAKGYGAGRGLRNGLAVTLLRAGFALAEPVTLVALGDSLTAGYGLEDPATGLVPQLEGWLQARGHDVVVQNAGVSGDTTAGGLARVGWALGPNGNLTVPAAQSNPGWPGDEKISIIHDYSNATNQRVHDGRSARRVRGPGATGVRVVASGGNGFLSR